ncbi:MAG: hypothetical protein HYU39_03600 [Thaumarchaeota archaeon]|nr:hypothetical protein [Nitrososphaerota archaeon]
MKDRSYWKSCYVLETNADEIEREIKLTNFASRAKNLELVHFEKGRNAPSILISQGSGGHPYVFAELGYLMHLKRYNVFIMPKHGSNTVNELVDRHRDAIKHISSNFNDRIGVFSEGLGGFVTFYLALDHSPMRSLVCQNSPGILTEKKFQEAYMRVGASAKRRKQLLPLVRVLAKLLPKMKLPISLYLDWKELIDTKEENRKIETRLVEGYMKDPDFDRWYTLSAIMSLVLTPPPSPIGKLSIPTMFLVPVRGWTEPSYVKDLYNRLPHIKRKLVQVDGSVYWMCSHPKDATDITCEWFDETL